MTVVAREPRANAAFLRLPRSGNHHDLGLFGVGPQPRPPRGSLGLYHLAWQVDTIEELEEARRTLAELGALTGESSHGATKSVYAQDPDGHEFEVMWMLPKASWATSRTPPPSSGWTSPGRSAVGGASAPLPNSSRSTDHDRLSTPVVEAYGAADPSAPDGSPTCQYSWVRATATTSSCASCWTRPATTCSRSPAPPLLAAATARHLAEWIAYRLPSAPTMASPARPRQPGDGLARLSVSHLDPAGDRASPVDTARSVTLYLP